MKLIILLSFLNFNEMNKTATFGSGCFWCTEAIYELVDGVEDVISGYSAGNTENPTYKDVTSGKTNHAEVVNVIYDPEKVSYLELLEIFWRTHDPTTLNRQGADVGTQYRSIILYHDDEQRELAEKTLERLDNSGSWKSPIVTLIEPFNFFILQRIIIKTIMNLIQIIAIALMSFHLKLTNSRRFSLTY